MRFARAALAFLIATGAVSMAWAAQSTIAFNLHVTIDGIKVGGGTLRIALHDEATFSDARAMPLRRQDLANIAGDVSVEFARLPPGSYAVKVFQDINNNGARDAGEPQGLSNGAADNDFDRAALDLRPGNNDTVIHLR